MAIPLRKPELYLSDAQVLTGKPLMCLGCLTGFDTRKAANDHQPKGCEKANETALVPKSCHTGGRFSRSGATR